MDRANAETGDTVDRSAHSLRCYELVRVEHHRGRDVQCISEGESSLRRFLLRRPYETIEWLGPRDNTGKECLVELHFVSAAVVAGFRQYFKAQKRARNESSVGVSSGCCRNQHTGVEKRPCNSSSAQWQPRRRSSSHSSSSQLSKGCPDATMRARISIRRRPSSVLASYGVSSFRPLSWLIWASGTRVASSVTDFATFIRQPRICDDRFIVPRRSIRWRIVFDSHSLGSAMITRRSPRPGDRLRLSTPVRAD